MFYLFQRYIFYETHMTTYVFSIKQKNKRAVKRDIINMNVKSVSE